MVTSIAKFLQLLKLLFRYGRLHHSGYDFNEKRGQSLLLIESQLNLSVVSQTTLRKKSTRLPNNSIVRNLISQAAFIKQCLRGKTNLLLHLPAHNLSYVRIPKSGSTSMGHSLLQGLYPDKDFSMLNSLQANFLLDVHLQSNFPHNVLFFTVVRNPLARLVSVYRSFFEDKSGHFLYQDYLFGIFDRDISFQEFVKRLQYIPTSLLDQHLKPQTRFIEFYKNNGIDVKVFKLESPQLIKEFLTSYNLSFLNLNKNPNPPDLQLYYDSETLKIVQKVYENDFKILGYKIDCWPIK